MERCETDIEKKLEIIIKNLREIEEGIKNIKCGVSAIYEKL